MLKEKLVHIGLLEDDESLIKIINLWIQHAGHTIQAYTTGSSFREGLVAESFDVLVLDWFLPDTTGLKELDWLRGEMDLDLPVIFMTSLDDEESIINALNHGADDYIVKPVSSDLLMARINALYRRHRLTPVIIHAKNSVDQMPAQLLGIENYDPYQINHSQRCFYLNGEKIKLTNKEYELATYIFQHENNLLTREVLLESIWGTRAELNTRTVDTHISRIRTKLSINENVGWKLSCIYQSGYRLFRAH